MANKHFFKPLLPGFHSHLTIPLAFLKNMEGRNEKKTAKLISDVSEIIWEVKIDGERITDGWKEFALAHDLRIGDIVIFRQEKDMAFHVTIFGPSCCEIHYESCLEDQNNLEKIERKKKVKKNPKREAESSSLDPSRFEANVAPSSLPYDRLCLPRRFVRENGLDTRSGDIVLMNQKGKSWTLALKQKKSCGTVYIHRGWRSFCKSNGLKAGDIFIFKLTRKRDTLVLRLSSTESDSEEEEDDSEGDEIESLSTDEESDQDEKISPDFSRRKEKKRRSPWKASSSPSRNRFVTLTLRPYNVKKSILFLPSPFTSFNGINEKTKMTLMDEHGAKWSTKLGIANKRIKMVGGWKDFFKAINVETGESVRLKLIWEEEDTSCVLKFWSKVKQETPNEN